MASILNNLRKEPHRDLLMKKPRGSTPPPPGSGLILLEDGDNIVTEDDLNFELED